MIKKWLNKKTYLTLGSIILIVLAVVLATAFSNNNAVAVATVEGEDITKDELYDLLVSYYGVDALDSLIDNKIVDIEADKKKITISDDEIKKEMDAYIEEYGGEEAFNSALEQSGMTSEDFEKDITNYLKIVKLLESKVEITDEEIQTYFDENKESYDTAEQVEASHILVADEATAKDIKTKLDAGEDFAKLAKEYSTDTATAESGGELGYFSATDMEEAFSNAAFSMEAGAISDPVQTSYGYHIIKVTDKQVAKEATLKEFKDEIKDTLFDQEIQTEYKTWIADKKESLDIKNTLVESEE
jgi:foldase protein PrsA